MRELTTNEKQIIHTLLYYKESGKIEELQVMRLLRRNLNCMAIGWELNPKPVISIYYKDGYDKTNLDRDYFELCDFLYFIDELVENKYVAIQYSSSINENEVRLLYNKDLYMYSKDLGTFCYKNEYGKKVFVASPKVITNNYLNFAQKLEMYANAIIYPLPLLKDFHDNIFLSVEQRRYEKQYRQTWWSVVIAAFFSLLGALLGALLEKYLC